jgi:hypothetical protein
MPSRYRRFEGDAARRASSFPRATGPAVPAAHPSANFSGNSAVSSQDAGFGSSATVSARCAGRPSKHPAWVYRGVHRRWEDTRDSWTRHRGDRPAAGQIRICRLLLAFLHADPPFRDGQTHAPSHLRRKIRGDFHAGANFHDHRAIPAHELISLVSLRAGRSRPRGTPS